MSAIRHWRWDGLWRVGAGTPDDPNNGRLIVRLTGLRRLNWALNPNYFRPDALRGSRLRALYWYVLRHYGSEICERCGRPVQLVFHAPDAIWELVTGHARFPSGEAAPGILCPKCVSDLYEEATPRGPAGYLRWTCEPTDVVMRG